MKKVLLAFICVFITITLFVGCSGTDNSSPEESDISEAASGILVPIPVDSIRDFHSFLLASRAYANHGIILDHGVTGRSASELNSAILHRVFGDTERYYMPAWLPEGFSLSRVRFNSGSVAFIFNIDGFDEDQNFIHEYLLNNQIYFVWFTQFPAPYSELFLKNETQSLGLAPATGIGGLYYYDFPATQDLSVNVARGYYWIQDGYVFTLSVPLWVINQHSHRNDGFGAASLGDSIADLVMNSALPVELVDGVNYVEPVDIAIVDPGVDIAIGETLELIANVFPYNVTIDAVVWSSGDNRVATVTQSGVVTRLSEGAVTITARAVASNINAMFELGGADDTILPEAIILSQTEASVYVGNTFTLSATILPENATDQTITWTSGDESIATVSPTGVVTGISAGTATITATTVNGLTAICMVTVTEDDSGDVMPESVIISTESPDFCEVEGLVVNLSEVCCCNSNATIILTAAVFPHNAEQTIIWDWEWLWEESWMVSLHIGENGVLVIELETDWSGNLYEVLITATAANGVTESIHATFYSIPSIYR